jgi:hypothetical protein
MAHAAIHAARQLGRLAFAYEVYGMIRKTVAACAEEQQQQQEPQEPQEQQDQCIEERDGGGARVYSKRAGGAMG